MLLKGTKQVLKAATLFFVDVFAKLTEAPNVFRVFLVCKTMFASRLNFCQIKYEAEINLCWMLIIPLWS